MTKTDQQSDIRLRLFMRVVLLLGCVVVGGIAGLFLAMLPTPFYETGYVVSGMLLAKYLQGLSGSECQNGSTAAIAKAKTEMFRTCKPFDIGTAFDAGVAAATRGQNNGNTTDNAERI